MWLGTMDNMLEIGWFKIYACEYDLGFHFMSVWGCVNMLINVAWMELSIWIWYLICLHDVVWYGYMIMCDQMCKEMVHD